MNTSGGQMAAAHDFTQGRVFDVLQPGTLARFRQKQVPQPLRLGDGLQFFHNRLHAPRADIFGFPVNARFIRIDMRLHEIQKLRFQRRNAFRFFGNHPLAFTLTSRRRPTNFRLAAQYCLTKQCISGIIPASPMARGCTGFRLWRPFLPVAGTSPAPMRTTRSGSAPASHAPAGSSLPAPFGPAP